MRDIPANFIRSFMVIICGHIPWRPPIFIIYNRLRKTRQHQVSTCPVGEESPIGFRNDAFALVLFLASHKKKLSRIAMCTLQLHQDNPTRKSKKCCAFTYFIPQRWQETKSSRIQASQCVKIQAKCHNTTAKLSVPKTLRFQKRGNAAIWNRAPQKSQQFYISESLGTFDLSLLFHRQKIAIWNLRFRNAAICDFIPRLFCGTCSESCDLEFAIWKCSDCDFLGH